MCKKWIRKYILPTMLALALPATAMAQISYSIPVSGTLSGITIGDVNDIDISGTGATTPPGVPGFPGKIGAGVAISATDDYIGWFNATAWEDIFTQNDGTLGTGNIYTIAAFDISDSLTTSFGIIAAAIVADDASGGYDIGHFSITDTGSSNEYLAGFLYYGGTDFTGTIDGRNVSVTSSNPGALVTCGVLFQSDWIGMSPTDINTAQSIKFGAINVTGGAMATGFEAGDVTLTGGTAALELGDINVTGGVEALGFVAGDVTLTGAGATLTLGDITVTGEGNAIGIEVASITLAGGATNTFGEIRATATGTSSGYAYGIVATGNATFTLTNDITVNAVDTEGVYVSGDANITIDGHISVIANDTSGGSGSAYGFWFDGDDSTLTFTTDSKLETTSILAANNLFTGGDLNITFAGGNELKSEWTDVFGNLTITGDGLANLGALYMNDGNITVGGGNAATVLGVDIGVSYLGTGNKKFYDGSKLAIMTTQGTRDADLIPDDFEYDFSDSSWYFGDTAAGSLDYNDNDWGMINYQDDQFANWTLENGVLSFGGWRGNANMSDGFVAALTMHNKYAIWNAVRDKLISGSGYARNGYRGQAACDPCEAVGCNPCDPICGSGSGLRSAWVNYLGRNDSYRSSFNNRNWKLSMEGVQAGTDFYRTRSAQVGMLFAYEKGSMYNDSRLGRDSIKADDTYVGVYGARVLRGGADIRGAFALGWQNYKMNRWASDLNLYTSSFRGYTSETNLELGKRLAAGAWSLRPVVALDIYNNNLKSATEMGAGILGVVYNKTSLTQVFARTGSDLRYQAGRFTFNSGLYYAYDMNGQALKADVGASKVELVGSKLGRELLTINLGSEYQLSRSFSLFGGYEGQYTLDGATKSAQNIGTIGGIVKW